MRLLLMGILVFLASAGLSFGADSIWERTGDGIREADVRAVAVSPADAGVLYAGTINSIYRSIDGGKSWDSVYSLSGTFKAVNSFFVHPAKPELVMAATQNGLYISRDGGKNWDLSFRGVDIFQSEVLHAGGDPGDPSCLYAATARGLFLSSDGGTTWQRAAGEVGDLMCRWVTTAPSGGAIYVATHKGVYCSLDRGERWDRIYVTTEEEFPYDEIEAEELFQDETLLDLYGKVRSVVLDPLAPANLYLACFNGVFHSADRGKTWEKLPDGGLSTSDIKIVITASAAADRVLVAATHKGAFVYSVTGRYWSELYQGITSRDFRFIAVDGGKPSSLWGALRDGLYRVVVQNPTAGAPAVTAPGAGASTTPQDGGKKRTRRTASTAPKGQAAPAQPVAEAVRNLAPAEVLRQFSGEPTVLEVQNWATWFAECQPEKIESWRKQSRVRHWFPSLSISSNRAVNKTVDVKGSSTNPFYVIGPDDESGYVTYSLSWDFSNIIWSSDQTSIDTRSRLTAQLRDDVLDQTTKTYFERRRLQVENILHPSSDINEQMKRELRVQELTAQLDALTGGVFSSELARRAAAPAAQQGR